MNLPLKQVTVHTIMKKMLPITPLGAKFADMINPHMIIGIINKGPLDVLDKAIQICMECIGIA